MKSLTYSGIFGLPVPVQAASTAIMMMIAIVMPTMTSIYKESTTSSITLHKGLEATVKGQMELLALYNNEVMTVVDEPKKVTTIKREETQHIFAALDVFKKELKRTRFLC